MTGLLLLLAGAVAAGLLVSVLGPKLVGGAAQDASALGWDTSLDVGGLALAPLDTGRAGA